MKNLKQVLMMASIVLCVPFANATSDEDIRIQDALNRISKIVQERQRLLIELAEAKCESEGASDVAECASNKLRNIQSSP